MPATLAKAKEEFPLDSPMIDFLDTDLSPATQYHYIQLLKRFFESLGLNGSLDTQSREFLKRAKNDREWAQNGLKFFIRTQKERANQGELSEATICNFYKPVRLFCDIHDIELSWKKITNTIPTGRKFANDRAPTVDEIKKLIEYPDRRIKPIALTFCSSGIRLGAWDYLKWKHIVPMRKDNKIVAAKIVVYAGENEQYYRTKRLRPCRSGWSFGVSGAKMLMEIVGSCVISGTRQLLRNQLSHLTKECHLTQLRNY